MVRKTLGRLVQSILTDQLGCLHNATETQLSQELISAEPGTHESPRRICCQSE